MALNDLLLVTRNYKGLCEENFLSTINEFLDEYCSFAGPKYSAGLKEVLVAAEPYKWDASHYVRPDVSFDMRMCQGEEDLLKFLAGDYNDSVEEMEDRNPGSSGMYDFWYAENRFDFFSPLAVKEVERYANERSVDGKGFMDRLLNYVPDFSFSSFHAKQPSLADVIKNAEQQRSFGGYKGSAESFLEI